MKYQSFHETIVFDGTMSFKDFVFQFVQPINSPFSGGMETSEYDGEGECILYSSKQDLFCKLEKLTFIAMVDFEFPDFSISFMYDSDEKYMLFNLYTYREDGQQLFHDLLSKIHQAMSEVSSKVSTAA